MVTAITKAKNKKAATNLFNSLLTETEMLMLAKRLTAVIMLSRNFSFKNIEGILKISSSTIARIHNDYRNGKYIYLEESIINKKDKIDSIIKIVEKIATFKLPPRVGRDRWIKYRNQ